MSFKQNPTPSRCPALPGTGVLHVHGRDAGAFLQAQAMNDVAALGVGRWHWNGLLTAKGRVIFLFALARVADDGFLLVAPDAGADELKAHLQRFVFRSKLALDETGVPLAAAGVGEGGVGDNQLLDGGDGAIGLDVSGEGGARVLWLLPAAHPALAPAVEATTAAWRLADLAHGLPRLDLGQREAWTPQMLSLDRLAAYSLKKGCYPGQEIVARTHYLGQAKRGLARFATDTRPQHGAAVTDATGRELGRIACVAGAGDGAEVLAVLPAELPADTSLSAGTALAPLPLLPGLAR